MESTGEGFNDDESWPTGEAGGTLGCITEIFVALCDNEVGCPDMPGSCKWLLEELACTLGLRLLVRETSFRRPTTKYVRCPNKDNLRKD